LITTILLLVPDIKSQHEQTRRVKQISSGDSYPYTLINPETIIRYFVTNLNKHEHSIRGGHLVYWYPLSSTRYKVTTWTDTQGEADKFWRFLHLCVLILFQRIRHCSANLLHFRLCSSTCLDFLFVTCRR